MFERRRSHHPALELGWIVATSGVAARLTPEDITTAHDRHRSRDWGELTSEDRLANDHAVVARTRVLSTYRAVDGTPFWILTEADRSVTTVLLPEEY